MKVVYIVVEDVWGGDEVTSTNVSVHRTKEAAENVAREYQKKAAADYSYIVEEHELKD